MTTLWSPGNPGAGKTSLTSIVFEHLTKRHEGQNMAVLIAYCDYRDPRTQSVDSLVAALIKQALQRSSAVTQGTKEMYQRHSKRAFPSLTDLIETLHAELAQFENFYILSMDSTRYLREQIDCFS